MRPAVMLISLGLHVGLALLLFLNLPPTGKKSLLPVEIAIRQSEIRSAPKGIKKFHASAKTAVARFGDSVLFPKYAPPKSVGNSRSFDSGIAEVFGPDGNKNWSFHREVYSRIDTGLVFDSLLAQYSHFGRVHVQFTVTQTGILKLDELKADADDAILKVHVLRAISKSLSVPLEINKFSKVDAHITFHAQFDFSFGGADNFDKQKNFGKPVFVFRRHTMEKPVPAEMLEHLLSGGVTPNISQMYERWQKYNKKKYLKAVEFDPFESYRRDPFYLL